MADSIGLRVGDPRFWDQAQLRQEIDRIFDICHSCRLCFKFCGSFPTLFELVDKRTEKLRQDYLAAHPDVVAAAARRREEDTQTPESAVHAEGERGVTYGDELPELTAHTRELTTEEIDHVVELCFQCKLCYPNCPYTPPHEFAIDFPRLLLRWKAQRVRQQGVPWRARVMRNTRLIGAAASVAPAAANWALRNPLNRMAIEHLVGIHRDKLMPTYYAETFPQWWSQHAPQLEPALPARQDENAAVPLKVALFSTCVVDYNDPGCGRAAVQVCEHNGIEVAFPDGQVCCGMPYLDEGDLDAAAEKIKHNVEILRPWVDRGYVVVVPSPSCSLMIREEFPQLLASDDCARVAARTHDLNEYLYRVARQGCLKRDFKRRFGTIRYHVPCHIRVQNIGIRGRDLLRLIADDVEVVQECSGHDGTWSMQVDHFEESLHWGRKAFAGMRAHAGEACSLACSDCRLAALHLRQGALVSTVHPVVALAHAYGYDVKGCDALESKPVTSAG